MENNSRFFLWKTKDGKQNEKKTQYLFTSEVVSPGHPDKCADIIADSIVDKLIIEDKDSRVVLKFCCWKTCCYWWRR